MFQSATIHARMSLEGGALVAAVVGGLAAAALILGALLVFFRHWMQVRQYKSQAVHGRYPCRGGSAAARQGWMAEWSSSLELTLASASIPRWI